MKRYSTRDIALALGRSQSTIVDELKRNKTRGQYDSKKANHKAYVRRKYSKYQGMKIVDNDRLKSFVDDLLYDDQSPEAIAGRLKRRQRSLPYVSKDSIYRYIKSFHGRRIEYHRGQIRRKKRHHRSRAKPWQDRTFIDKRPPFINNRRRVGDAEGDFIVSGKSGHGILLVIEDRKLRTTFLEQILEPNLTTVTRAFNRIKKRYPEWQSLTLDNDILFQHYKKLEKKFNIKIYFCFPGHAWEKGAVENRNAWLRRYISKGSDLSRFSKQFIKNLEIKHNRRFMKILNYRSPQEVLNTYRKRKKRSRRLD